MIDCVFCNILNDKLLGSFVYKGELCSAFLDIHPINEGHILIVPNRHASRFSDLTQEEAANLFVTGQTILKAIIRSGIRCEGANLFLSDGVSAGQEVDHTHLHIVPRFSSDGQRIGFKHAGIISREHLNTVAESIRIQVQGN